MNRVLNFGSLNIDHVYRVDHFVAPGETSNALSYQIFPGGKGLNQSIALARAGAVVFHAGKMGQDGLFLAHLLEQDGVDTSLLAYDGTVTGHAVIQVDAKGQNSILIHGGANREIKAEEIGRVLAGFGPGDLLVLQNEISGIDSILHDARARGMAIALNPSPIDGALSGYPLELVDWFLLNETEGEALTAEREPEHIAAALAMRYPGARIVLTLGGAGVLYRDADRQYVQPSFHVPVVDTTAAGDTFTGYFLAGALCGTAVLECLQMATAAAALAVSRSGAATSIPYRSEVTAFCERCLASDKNIREVLMK